MITYTNKSYEDAELFNILNSAVKEWFKNKFGSFCIPQKYAIMPIHSRENILVCAPTGSGKCITPDSTVLLNLDGDAKLLTGKDLIDLTKQGKLIKKFDNSGRLYDIQNLQSYSLHENQTKKTKALVYFENYNGKIYNIKTEYGREIRLSPDHPLLVERRGKEEWVPVRDIKKGEKIGSPIKIVLPEKEIGLEYRKAIFNLRKNSDILIDYGDYTRLKRKTKKFTEFKNLTPPELYEIKTLLRTSLHELGKELNMGITTAFRLLNGHSNYKRSDLYKLLRK